jgi:thiaminase
MAFLDEMWSAASASIAATEEHPFLKAMLDGSLPMEKFQFYIVQVDFEMPATLSWGR